MTGLRYIVADPSKHRAARESAHALAADLALPVLLAPEESNGVMVNGVVVIGREAWALRRFAAYWRRRAEKRGWDMKEIVLT